MNYPFVNEDDWDEISVLIEVPVKQATVGTSFAAADRVEMRVTLAELAEAIRYGVRSGLQEKRKR